MHLVIGARMLEEYGYSHTVYVDADAWPLDDALRARPRSRASMALGGVAALPAQCLEVRRSPRRRRLGEEPPLPPRRSSCRGESLGGEPRGEGARGRVSPRDGPGAPRGRRGSGRAARPRDRVVNGTSSGRRRLQQRVLETRALGRLDARAGKRVETRLLRRPDRADRGARPRGRARTVASPAVQRHGHATVLVRAQFVRRTRSTRVARRANAGAAPVSIAHFTWGPPSPG